jgi:hypothetical protein
MDEGKPRAVHVALSPEQEDELHRAHEADPDVAVALAVRWADEQERDGAPRPPGGMDLDAWVDLWRCLCGDRVWGEEPYPLNHLYENHDPFLVAYAPAAAAQDLAACLGRVDRGWLLERHRTVSPDRARALEGDYRPVPAESAWAHLEYARDLFGWAGRQGRGVQLLMDLTRAADPGCAAGGGGTSAFPGSQHQ